MSDDDLGAKILEYLKTHDDFDHSVTSIAKALNANRTTVGNILKVLPILSKNVIKTRKIAKADMYKWVESDE